MVMQEVERTPPFLTCSRESGPYINQPAVGALHDKAHWASVRHPRQHEPENGPDRRASLSFCEPASSENPFAGPSAVAELRRRPLAPRALRAEAGEVFN